MANKKIKLKHKDTAREFVDSLMNQMDQLERGNAELKYQHPEHGELLFSIKLQSIGGKSLDEYIADVDEALR